MTESTGGITCSCWPNESIDDSLWAKEMNQKIQTQLCQILCNEDVENR